MSIRSKLVLQFRQPKGLLGIVAGSIMAMRPSNRQRNDWTVGLLALESSHRVLEVGCGPGLALLACAKKLDSGYIVGIDHSQVMVAQATNRIKKYIGMGRAEVVQTTLEKILTIDGSDRYDRIYSLNVIQFVDNLEDTFIAISHGLNENGLVATTYQPRTKNPTKADAISMAERIESAMIAAGFRGIERRELTLVPAPAICITGWK